MGRNALWKPIAQDSSILSLFAIVPVLVSSLCLNLPAGLDKPSAWSSKPSSTFFLPTFLLSFLLKFPCQRCLVGLYLVVLSYCGV